MKLSDHNIKGSEECGIIGDAVAIIDVLSVEEGCIGIDTDGQKYILTKQPKGNRNAA